MAQILWRPIKDEIDRAKFTFECPDDWTPIDGWTGRDIEDPGTIYMLETIAKGKTYRGIIRKFVPVAGTKAVIRPVDVPPEVIDEASDHIGFTKFTVAPVDQSASRAVWIIPLSQ